MSRSSWLRIPVLCALFFGTSLEIEAFPENVFESISGTTETTMTLAETSSGITHGTAWADSVLEDCLRPLGVSLSGPYHQEVLREVLSASPERIKALLSIPRTWQSQVDAVRLPSWFSLLPLLISRGDTRYRKDYTAGYWGLTQAVALRYGLVVTSNYDERHDREKSTDAALRYWFDLRPNYSSDWMALLAFVNTPLLLNNTFVHMKELLFHSLTIEDNVIGFWHYNKQSSLLKPDFPIELAKLLYWQRVFSEISDNSLNALPTAAKASSAATQTAIPLASKAMVACPLQQPIYISLLCSMLALNEDDFRKDNPCLLEKDFVEAGCSLYLPANQARQFQEKTAYILYRASQDRIAQEEAAYQKAAQEASAPLIYKIRPGDTLSGIAQRYRVRASDIKRWNNLKSDRIYIGQSLKIVTKR